MDSQIYMLRFNNGESIFFAHQKYLKKFGYFEQYFSGEVLSEDYIIDIFLDYHLKTDKCSFRHLIGENSLTDQEINNKIFNKKIIQLALYVIYSINFNVKLSSQECYDFVMLMDFLQYNKMNDIDNIIYKLYDGSEDFNILVNNHYDNCSANRIKKNLLEICISDKFKRQLFHYGHIPIQINIALNDNNKYYVNFIKIYNNISSDKFTLENNIGDWIKFVVGEFLHIFDIKIYKFEYVFGINKNELLDISNININDNILPFVFSDDKKREDNTINFNFKVDLNSFVTKLILKQYCNSM